MIWLFITFDFYFFFSVVNLTVLGNMAAMFLWMFYQLKVLKVLHFHKLFTHLKRNHPLKKCGLSTLNTWFWQPLLRVSMSVKTCQECPLKPCCTYFVPLAHLGDMCGLYAHVASGFHRSSSHLIETQLRVDHSIILTKAMALSPSFHFPIWQSHLGPIFLPPHLLPQGNHLALGLF